MYITVCKVLSFCKRYALYMYLYIYTVYLTCFVLMHIYTHADNYDRLNTQYCSIGQMAQRLNLDPVLVARITSSIYCEKGSSEK